MGWEDIIKRRNKGMSKLAEELIKEVIIVFFTFSLTFFLPI